MRRTIRGSVVCAAAILAVATVGAPAAFGQKAWWRLGVGARPTVLPSATESGGRTVSGEGEIVLSVENVGDARTVECVRVIGTGRYTNPDCSEAGVGAYEKEPVKVVDSLPVGLRALGIAGVQPALGGALSETEALSCSLEHLSCETVGPIVPFDQLEVRIRVEVLPGAKSGETDTVAVSGGGGVNTQSTRPIAIGKSSASGGGAAPFGVEDYELTPEEEGGAPATQAGSHPYQATGTIALNQGPDAESLTGPPQAGAVAPAKDIVAELPPGLIANPGEAPRCLGWEFLESDGLGKGPECSGQSAVGVASVTVDVPGGVGTRTVASPIFNLEPEAGEPARFGFFVPVVNVPVQLNTSVRSGPGEDWGVDLSTSELPEDSGLVSARVTFWGTPRRAAHNDARGWGCLDAARGRGEVAYEPCVEDFEELHPPAFVTMPTSCTGPLQSAVTADSWAAPGVFAAFAPGEALPALSGCDRLAFTPTISTEPTTHAAASPSGLAFDLAFDTEGLDSATGLAQSDLQRTEVTLPEGVTIDPSAGVGLGACTWAQYAEATLSSPPGAGCPEDSKLGTVEIETPLLFTTVYGTLYLAQPYENPFSEPGHPNGSLVAVYVIARSRAERGIIVKLAGEVTPNPQTGQLTVIFEGDPQLPFAHFNFHFKEGQQAPLITPPLCGTYTTHANLTPFAEPNVALADTSTFQITSGSEGTACPTGSLPPFAPAIQSFTLTNEAGVFSPLSVELTRSDAMQEIADYTTDLPVGLTANLTGIPFCPQAAIEASRHRTGVQEENEPSCPQASLIGHTLVGTGVGSVLDYVPGRLYLAGPFHGDPFSVVSVTSAVVGPFDLGTIVIRFALAIEPFTGQVRIDPTGSEPIPTIIDGIVTHVRDIRVSIDRTGFVLNPTSCQPRPLSSTLTSDHGQTTTISTAFQTVKCNELSFTTHFTAATRAKTSRVDGASLSVKLTMPIKLGEQSNIQQVKVELPRQLPARLPTLQKACTEAQFDTDPAGCPPASMIGHAKAVTPIVPEPLQGPAIFVSHGGAEFPSLVLVLQGYGVTIDVVGATHISPQGILSSTFKAVPDEPVGSFELTMPEGEYSALAALGNLCHDTKLVIAKARTTVKLRGRRTKVLRRFKKRVSTLIMPTQFVGQNGATRRQGTRIEVTGCTRSERPDRRRQVTRRRIGHGRHRR
jgi:hypothetical protein